MNNTPPPAAPVEMQEQTAEPTARQALQSEIGLKLSQSREASGESIEQAVRKLKLQKSYLLALENGNWNHMPDDVYTLGFLRQYSQHLHVDLSDEIDRLKNDQYTLTKPLTFSDPPVAPSRRWAWLAGIAFVMLFLLFNITMGNHHVPSIATDESPQTPPVESSTINTHHAVDKTVKMAIDKSILVFTPAKSASMPIMHHFRFDAVGSPVWLQISMPDQRGAGKGRLLKEVLLQTSTHTVINKKTTTLWITCGNAPALRIYVDGNLFAATGSLGAGKKVLRDYRFSINN